MMRTPMRLALTTIAVLTLAGCGDRQDKVAADASAAAAPTNKTLAETLKDDTGHAALARLADNAGLVEALDGVGPYTLFAPADAVLSGQAGADFTDPAMSAEDAALLRAHIVPGALTRADIAAAVDASAGKGAQMRTMAGGLLTFTRDGDVLVATAPDGASVRLTGDQVLASNGVLQPTDGLLMKAAAAAN